MAMVPKARDLEQSLTGATIRLAQREGFDRRSAVNVPSATGGAPDQNLQPLPMPDLTKQSERPANPAEQSFWQGREAPSRMPIIPFLMRTRRPVEDYDVTNKDFIDYMGTVFADLAGRSPAWQNRVDIAGDARELALQLVAQWQRAHEPDVETTDLPAAIHRSRSTQEVADILDWIHAQRARR